MRQIIVPTDTPGFTVGRKIEKMGNHSSRHRRAGPRRRPGAGGQHDRRDRPRLPAADGAVPGRAPDRRLHGRRRRAPGDRPHRSTTCGSARRSASRCWPTSTCSTASPSWSPRSTCCRSTTTRPPSGTQTGEDVTRMATIAKLKAGRLAREVADTAVQFHGGMGYAEENWPARYCRDSRLISIGGGADEVMLRVISLLEGMGSDERGAVRRRRRRSRRSRWRSPETRNVLDADAHGARCASTSRAPAADDAVRVVVLTGEGNTFCAGADLRGARRADAERLHGQRAAGAGGACSRRCSTTPSRSSPACRATSPAAATDWSPRADLAVAVETREVRLHRGARRASRRR